MSLELKWNEMMSLYIEEPIADITLALSLRSIQLQRINSSINCSIYSFSL